MLLIRISFLCLFVNIAIFASFNTASDYFNAASQTYILHKDIKSAKKYIADGLTAFPNDDKLKKLSSYMKDEEVKENKNQQNQQDQNQQNKEQDQQDKKDQEKKDDQKQDNQENKDQQKEQQQKEQEQEQQVQQDESKQDMKKEEAKRLIELYADDADSLNKPQKKANVQKGKFQKDW